MRNTNRKIVLGCRDSKLAIAQTNEVIDGLKSRFPDLDCDMAFIKTSGDHRRDVAVSQIGVGVFVKEIENALLNEEIDIAVHSLKDLPASETDGLAISAVPFREDPRDAVVSRTGDGLHDLPKGSIIATGSARRRALINAERGDLILKPIRGNVTTRLAMLDQEDSVIDALVLAAAGLKRLGVADRVSEYLGCMTFVVAPGQGALALQTRFDDRAIVELCAAVEHRKTRIEVDAERAFLSEIGGGCSAPIGAHARVEGSSITLSAMVAEPSGSRVLRRQESADSESAVELGKRVAGNMIEAGATQLLSRSVANGGG